MARQSLALFLVLLIAPLPCCLGDEILRGTTDSAVAEAAVVLLSDNVISSTASFEVFGGSSDMSITRIELLTVRGTEPSMPENCSNPI
jgi:hypothetical protein